MAERAKTRTKITKYSTENPVLKDDKGVYYDIEKQYKVRFFFFYSH